MRCTLMTPAYKKHIREIYTSEIYAHRSVTFLGGGAGEGTTRKRRVEKAAARMDS